MMPAARFSSDGLRRNSAPVAPGENARSRGSLADLGFKAEIPAELGDHFLAARQAQTAAFDACVSVAPKAVERLENTFDLIAGDALRRCPPRR